MFSCVGVGVGVVVVSCCVVSYCIVIDLECRVLLWLRSGVFCRVVWCGGLLTCVGVLMSRVVLCFVAM